MDTLLIDSNDVNFSLAVALFLIAMGAPLSEVVPTLSAWGLLALSTLLAVLVFTSLRRRRGQETSVG